MNPKRIDVIGGRRKCYGIFNLLEFKMIHTNVYLLRLGVPS